MTVLEFKNLVNSIPNRQNNKNILFEYSMFPFKNVNGIYTTKAKIKKEFRQEFVYKDYFEEFVGNTSVLISFGN